MNTFKTKTFLYALCAFFPVLGWGDNVTTVKPPRTLEEINKRLADLEEKLHQYQVKEMKKMVEGQSLFLADWEKYGDDLEQIKGMDDRERELIEEIKKLELRKAELLKREQAPS